MWRFRPVESFESDRARRAYRSFLWTLVGGAPLMSIMSWWVFVYPQAGHIGAAPHVAVLATQVVVTSALYTAWVLRGVDLRRSRGQALAMCAPLALAPAALTAAGQAQDIAPVIIALLVPTSSFLLSFGPAWAGVVPVGATLAYTRLADVAEPFTLSHPIFTVAVWATFKSSIWYLEVFRAMEEAAQTRTAMRLAEERLRFAADLHDVMGQRLAAISLHAQTAATLARAGRDPAAPLATILELTDRSTADMRSMVTTYETPDWDSELRGATSLLEASGARVTVTGSVPDGRDAEAAFIIREATTNILKHANATRVSIDIDEAGMTIRNDGVQAAEPQPAWTGLAALQRRISPTALTATSEGRDFILTARWTHD